LVARGMPNHEAAETEKRRAEVFDTDQAEDCRSANMKLQRQRHAQR
jgi:hypothetical protein